MIGAGVWLAMGFLARIAGMTRGRVAPALLVLLLGVRVATAAAVDCQHELASAARAAEQAQEALRKEAAVLGGKLCRVEAGTATAHEETGPHLYPPCPFFKSPVTLPSITTNATARNLAFSWLVPAIGGPAIRAQAPRAAYSPRAPPRVTLR